MSDDTRTYAQKKGAVALAFRMLHNELCDFGREPEAEAIIKLSDLFRAGKRFDISVIDENNEREALRTKVDKLEEPMKPWPRIE